MKRNMTLLFGIVSVCCMVMTSIAWGDNGTVTVNGKVWLKDAGCIGNKTWPDAKSAVQSLKSGKCGLSDNSKSGNWRLPTISELVALQSSVSLFTNVQRNYWTSEIYHSSGLYYYVIINVGNYNNVWSTDSMCYTLPVRTY